MKRNALSLLAMFLCLSLGFSMTAVAQDPDKIWLREGPHRLLDTPEIMEQMDIARDLAGDDYYFLNMQRLQCQDIDDTYTVRESPGSNVVRNGVGWHEVAAVPTQVFDNVYYVGGMEVGGWLIDTGDGYIMLDSSYDYGVDEILLPNMAALGLDPAKIKYILITHAGPDHIGAAKYFQDNYGTKVVSDAPFGGSPSNPKPVPTIIEDGGTLTLGDTTITAVVTPRTVGGGGLSYLIPVKINGERHMWATFGNTNASTGTIEDKLVYRESMAKFIDYVKRYKADIAISSHPFVDASLERMEIIRECNHSRGYHKGWNKQECRQNPFLIGRKAALRYFEILDQCSEVQRNRQEAGIDSTGLFYLDEEEEPQGPPASTP